MGNIFQVSYIWQLISRAFRRAFKRGKYFPHFTPASSKFSKMHLGNLSQIALPNRWLLVQNTYLLICWFDWVNIFCIELGADYMEIFSPGWNFNSLNRLEISSRLKSKLLFKMALQLHVKISTRYTELKFQLSLANPRWNFNPGWKFQIFHIIGIFFQPGMNIWYYAHVNSLFIF